MTRQKSFKRIVRARMEKTGESYAAARAMLLTAPEEPEAAQPPVLATSDATIRERTGRGWEEWFDLLDEWGAAERPHREIARRLAEIQGIEPLAWNAQAVAISYERARGLRAVGQRADGFAITATRTIAAPAERVYDAFVDGALREAWLPGAALRERTATRPRSARFDWGAGDSRVSLFVEAKDVAKSTATLQHERLPDGAEADRMKAYWRNGLATLKSRLEA